MKKIVRIATLVGFAAVLTGTLSMSACNERPTNDLANTPQKVWLRSFVMGYYEPEGVELRVYKFDAKDYPENLVISMDVVKKETLGTFRDTGGPGKEIYDALCLKHGDMSFNREYTLPIDGGIVEYPAMDLVWIDVRSDRDFTTGLPIPNEDADTNENISYDYLLNDLITCRLYSAKPYIESGYCLDDCVPDEEFVYSIIEAPLTELNGERDKVGRLSLLGMGRNDDLDMHHHYIDRMGRLIFDEGMPVVRSGTYNIQITFTEDTFVPDPDNPGEYLDDPDYPGEKLRKKHVTVDEIVF